MSDSATPSATERNYDPSTSENAATEELTDAVIRFAGNSQDGIQTIGGFLAKLAGRSSQDVMTYMTIPSTISGGPSIFQVHLGTGEILSAGDECDFLVAFYQHSYDEHVSCLREGGICIYDSDQVKPDHSLETVKHVDVPITSLTVEAMGGSTRERGKNLFVLGLITQMFRLNHEKMAELIDRQFSRKGEQVLRNANLAFDAGYGYHIGGEVVRQSFNLKAGITPDRNRITTDGNTALTLGLLAGGVRYGAAYPITPWSTIMEQLRTELPKYGGLFVQAEDELGAVAIALGFAYAGHTAVTGSSGPGLSLKMEALSFATMAELPLVVINVMRGGPSTGLPTSVEQSDLMQAIAGSHGDCPRIIIAPKNVENCFYTGVEACHLARKYSCPVIILTDQALATRIEAFDEPELDQYYHEPKLDLEPRPADFVPYPKDRPTRHAPPGTKMRGAKYPVVTGLEHDEWGHPSGSPDVHQKNTIRRREKIKMMPLDYPRLDVFGEESGEVLLVGWGSTWGPIRAATKRALAQGRSIGCLHVRHVYPLPHRIEEHFANFEHVFVVEMNDEGCYGYGQFATILRARFCDPKIRSICKTDGLAFRVREILEGVDHLLGEEVRSQEPR